MEILWFAATVCGVGSIVLAWIGRAARNALDSEQVLVHARLSVLMRTAIAFLAVIWTAMVVSWVLENQRVDDILKGYYHSTGRMFPQEGHSAMYYYTRDSLWLAGAASLLPIGAALYLSRLKGRLQPVAEE